MEGDSFLHPYVRLLQVNLLSIPEWERERKRERVRMARVGERKEEREGEKLMRELREKSLLCNVILETRDELRGNLSLLSRSLKKEWRVRERLDRKTMEMVVPSKFKMICALCGSNSDNRTVFGDAALGGRLQFVKFEGGVLMIAWISLNPRCISMAADQLQVCVMGI